MPPAPEDDNGGSLKERIAKVFEVSLKLTVPDEPQVAPLIAICSKKEADYQCNNAMSLWSKIKGKNTEFRGPQPVGQAIIRNLPISDMIESCSIAGPGFINVKLSTQWIAKRIHNMLTQGIATWAPKLSVKRVVVDYSSPNIAKEMHVGHLRSTIIGDTIARMLEYSKVDVLRRNHVGDWGTQFGMLIEYLFERFPDGDVSEQDIGELEAFYKASKQRFDADENFKERARNAVVALQSGKEEKYRKAWAQICEISRKGFEKVYQRLGVDDLEEMGESFYNAYIPLVLKELEDKGLIKDDKGTQVIEIIEGKKVVATLKDGGYNSYIKDLAARCNQLKPDDVEWKILVTLQSGKEEKYQNAWAQICKISQEGLTKYQCPGIHLKDMGEGLNNTYIPVGPEERDDKGCIKDDGGDKVIKVFEGKKVVPIIVTKKDGGYNYASTDLAALWYRLNEEKAEWIIYVTDVGQSEHFKKIFAAAKYAEWLPHDESKYPKTSHVGFGLVLGDDGKRFRTRCTEVVKLVDLLDEAKTRCKAALEERGKAAEWAEEKLEQERVKAATEWTEEKLGQERVKAEKWAKEKLEKTAEAVGYGAVKYADLKNHRMTNYTFNFDQMLNDKGNTAVYLLYAHARICKIIEKSGKNIEELKREGQILLQTDHERKLGLHMLQFAEVVEEACISLLPNVLCEYLYDLSETFSSFYSECKVIGSVEETSRLLLCEATAVVMKKCFHLLGITDVDRI